MINLMRIKYKVFKSTSPPKQSHIKWISKLTLLGVSVLSLNTMAAPLQSDESNKPLISIEHAQKAPLIDLQMLNLSGNQSEHTSLSEFKGKVVLLDFWASWCGPCRESFPWMNKVMSRYKAQGFEVVAINLDKETKLAQAFLANVPANFTILQDAQGVMPEAYGVLGMPSSYLIDKSGRIRAAHVGFHTSKEMEYEKAILSLLDETEETL